METDLTLNYKLIGTGWAECTLDIYGTRCTVTASYLSDALYELISGVNHILAASSEARFSFDEEPGEYRWVLRRNAENGLTIRILEFPDLWGSRPDEDGKELINVTCQPRDFGVALLVSMNELLGEHGVAGYRDKWAQSEFPVEQYKALCARLGEPQSTVLRVDNRKVKSSKQKQ